MVIDFFNADKVESFEQQQAAADAAKGGAAGGGADAGKTDPPPADDEAAKKAAAAAADDPAKKAADEAAAKKAADDEAAKAAAAGADDPAKKAADEAAAKKAADDEAAKKAAAADPAKKVPGSDPDTPAPTAEQAEREATDKLLKKLGVATFEELQQKINPETEEEKTAKQEQFRASVNSYAVKKGKLTNAEIHQLETLKVADKQKLVYDNFVNNYKERFKDRRDTDNKPLPPTEDEIDEAYESIFHTQSENPVLKAEGEARINAKAADMIKPLQDKYNEAEALYKDRMYRHEQGQKYISYIQKLMKDAKPADITVGEGESKATFEFKPNDKEVEAAKIELEKLFMEDEMFEAYLQNEPAKHDTYYKTLIDTHLKMKMFPKIVDVLSQIRAEQLLKKSSDTGAKSPFEQTKAKVEPVAVNDNALTKDEAADINDAFRRF